MDRVMEENATSRSSQGNATQDAQPFAPPQLSLPKGGGAIRGIEEKFQANPVTGTGSLSITLPLSPGRFGFGPKLSLNYDSGTGNGIFGMGWSLSAPSIMRRTDKGLPKYRDSEESDVFVLSGAEDLVPALSDENDRTGFDEFERDGYRVKRYRPRIEGLFARIERWTRINGGETHWRSHSKDNVLTVYGLDANSRISDPEAPLHVFSWLISGSYDDKGNAIVYEYMAENECGIDLTKASERNRNRTANRYLKRIRYGNRVPVLIDTEGPSARPAHLGPHDLDTAEWMFEAIFDYGDGHCRDELQDQDGHVLCSAAVLAGADWPVRRDPFSSFRSGFEVRTYRLCRRVLMFHNFPELGIDSYLVRSITLSYDETPVGSFITRVVQSGHRRRANGHYLTRSLPAVEFSYSRSPLEDPHFTDYRLKDVDVESLANLPAGIDGDRYRWLDLDGEGISGVLTEQDRSWFYKPNLGDGRLGAIETVTARPSLAALSRGRQEFLDVAGDGNLDLVDLTAPAPGFYERTFDAAWSGFRSFHVLPVRDWGDPNLRFVDLTGDGIADVLITEDCAFTWHPSLRREGFGPGIRVAVPLDEAEGPRIVFADGTQSIYLADLTGDGLSDILRIRNGEVCFWPHQGYGRFGAKVTMDHAPWFDEPDLFDQRHIRLADTDGSGTTDILYLARDGIKIFLNESGNGWSSARHLRALPAIDNVSSVSVFDFLGRGTACLLWSSPLQGDAGRQLRYVDLMGGQKPHLLVRTANNLGVETSIEYASSTEFYLADKASGTPWVTRLPFPVHVVARVETYDYISRNRFVTRYTYHHGFYDGVEREFRGFGRVDQLDTEEFAALTAGGIYPVGENIDAASNIPPVLTKTWFHTGVYLQGGRISRHLAHEYYQEGSPHHGEAELSHRQIRSMLLDDTNLPTHLGPGEAREACRSLKGSVLRKEVYSLDGTERSSRPYTVAESNLTIRLLQKRGPNRHAVLYPHSHETITFLYERELYEINKRRRLDPRVSHECTLAVDDYGNVLQSVTVGYGRRFDDPSLNEADRAKQAQILLTLTETDYTNAVRERDAYRTPLPTESRTYELLQMRPDAALAEVTSLFRFEELRAKVEAAGDGMHDIDYHNFKSVGLRSGHPYRRLLKRTRTLYRPNDLGCAAGNSYALLPSGTLESRALDGATYKLAFTPRLITHIYRRNATPLLAAPADALGSVGEDGGGYVDLDGDGSWWKPTGGRVFYHAQAEASPEHELAHALRHFFMPRRFVDPFGNATIVENDRHDLLMEKTTDAVGNIVAASNDYRVLKVAVLTDPNGNRAAVSFDAVGLVAGTALMGKVTENLGDTLTGFAADLTQTEIDNFFDSADPGTRAEALLRDATTRIVYDIDRFTRSRAANRDDPAQWQPAYTATLSRETHATDPRPSRGLNIQISFSYSNGFGREVQKKAQAEPGPLVQGGPKVEPRWVGSGWTIFNNKDKPVRQYEPFFAATHAFEFDVRVGVSPILLYDPLGRVIATVHPNHSWEKVVFDPWRQESWDVNDTVLIADPKTDADVGGFFSRLVEADYLKSWYEERQSGLLGLQEEAAAAKTALHAATPSIAHGDSLGRVFLTIAHNRFERSGTMIDERYATRVELDIQGNQRELIDANGRIVVKYDYDMLGTRIHQSSMEAGERWTLNDVAGNPIRGWDSRDHVFRTTYDPLRRPTDSFLRESTGQELVIGRTIYGESQANAKLRNLRRKVVRLFDQAGVVTTDEYDFKGNLLSTRRQVAKNYKTTLDWAANPALEQEIFASATTYDALNRPVTVTTPDRSIYQPTFNKANLLEMVHVNLRGAQAIALVTNIDHDAKGQRVQIEYGNGTKTEYNYDHLTFRLAHLKTVRSSDGLRLQDLHYTYDPAGNITHIRDGAQQTIYFTSRLVSPDNDYTYDAAYRLIKATGREHIGQVSRPQTSWNDQFRVHLPAPGDGQKMCSYAEQYEYDAVGNFLRLIHQVCSPQPPLVSGNWTRTYAYSEPSQIEPADSSNRLTSTTIGGNQPTMEAYSYDAHGNITSMPHLTLMLWDFRDQLSGTARQARRDGTPETTYYVYDSTGRRVRKITERQNGKRKDERLYLGGFELYRAYDGGGTRVTLERETLHLLDDKRRIALIETRTRGEESGVPERLIRYQFGNHLDSASLELDAEGHIISYEEYYPYGCTSYQAVRSKTETPKRYRYTGMERDEESGFNCQGVRLYALWLARWICPDPAGVVSGPNLYLYGLANPIRYSDTNGRAPNDEEPVAPGPKPIGLLSMDYSGPNVCGGRACVTDDQINASSDKSRAEDEQAEQRAIIGRKEARRQRKLEELINEASVVNRHHWSDHEKDVQRLEVFEKTGIDIGRAPDRVNIDGGPAPVNRAAFWLGVGLGGAAIILATWRALLLGALLAGATSEGGFSGCGTLASFGGGAIPEGGAAALSTVARETGTALEPGAGIVLESGAGAVAAVDPQLDANVLMLVSRGDATAVAYANANRAAGLSYNYSARLEFLIRGTRAELRLLEERYGMRLIREVPLDDIAAEASRLRSLFTDGRVLGYWDSQVAATASLMGERMATADLQFFKRAMDLGLNVEYVGTGAAAARAAAYVPRPP
jgi:RHS repeat-associated protein